MRKEELSKKTIIQYFLLLLMLSISLSAQSGNSVLSFGLLGEVTTVAVVENQESSILASPQKNTTSKRYRIRISEEQRKIQYELLLLLVAIQLIIYWQHLKLYKKDKTPVVLKVRMNN